jgi:hypothetical protein
VTLPSCFHPSVVVSPPLKQFAWACFWRPGFCQLCPAIARAQIRRSSQRANSKFESASAGNSAHCHLVRGRATAAYDGTGEEMALKNTPRVSVGRIVSFYS